MPYDRHDWIPSDEHDPRGAIAPLVLLAEILAYPLLWIAGHFDRHFFGGWNAKPRQPRRAARNLIDDNPDDLSQTLREDPVLEERRAHRNRHGGFGL